MNLQSLPIELVYELLDQIDNVETAQALASTCQRFYLTIAPKIWSSVYINAEFMFHDLNSIPGRNDGGTLLYERGHLSNSKGQYYSQNCHQYCLNKYDFSTHHHCIKWCISVYNRKQLDNLMSYLESNQHILEWIRLIQVRAGGEYRNLYWFLTNFMNIKSMRGLDTIEIVEHRNTKIIELVSVNFPSRFVKKRYHISFTRYSGRYNTIDLFTDTGIETVSIYRATPPEICSDLLLQLFNTLELPSHIKYADIHAPRIDARILKNFIKNTKYVKLGGKIVGNYNNNKAIDWIPSTANHLTFWHDYDSERHNAVVDENNTPILSPTLNNNNTKNIHTAKLEGELATICILQQQLVNLVRLQLSRVPGENLAAYLSRAASRIAAAAATTTTQCFFSQYTPNLRQLTFEHNSHQHIIECMAHAPLVKSLIIRKGGDPSNNNNSNIQGTTANPNNNSDNCNLYKLVRVCTNLDFFLHEGTYEGLPTSVLAYFAFYCPNLDNFYLVSQKHNGLPFGIPAVYGPTTKPLYDGYSLITNLEAYYLLDMNAMGANRRITKKKKKRIN